MDNYTAKELFLEYKRNAERTFNDLDSLTGHSVPYEYIYELERSLRADATLAELWGTIASIRDGKNYLQDWRMGL